MIAHSFFDLLLYAFLAWAAEVCWYSVWDGRFVNSGFITLPFRLPYGIAFALLIQVLPTLGRNYTLQFIVTLSVVAVVRSLAGTFTHRTSRMAHWEPMDTRAIPDNTRDGAISLAIAGAVLLVYYIIHPVLAGMILLLPHLLVRVLVIGAAMLRYNTREIRPTATGIVEQFLDSRYGDDYIEHRWPNMIVTES